MAAATERNRVPDSLIETLAMEPSMEWFDLGIKLGLDSRWLTSLGRPLRAPSVLSRMMLDRWLDSNVKREPEDKLKEKLRNGLIKCDRRDLSEEVLDERDFREIFDSLSGKLTYVWENLAIRFLNFERSEIDDMKAPSEESPSLATLAKKVLRNWQETSPETSFNNLIKGLRAIKKENLVSLVEKSEEYQKYLSTSMTSTDIMDAGREANLPYKIEKADVHKTSAVENASKFIDARPNSERLHPVSPPHTQDHLPQPIAVAASTLNIEGLFLPTDHNKQEAVAALDYPLEVIAPRIKIMRQESANKHSQVTVALLDTGIYEQHPDLQNVVTERLNLVHGLDKDLTEDPMDHGTACAGILRKYAPFVKILNLKVLPYNGTNAVATALKSINVWDKEHPDQKVDIISISLGGKHHDKEQAKLIDEFAESKVIVCAAHNYGNITSSTMTFPANHGKVLAIGSCNNYGDRCSHSGVGDQLGFLFPGENVTSTCNKSQGNKYRKVSGTSFATPHASALVAVILAYIEAKFSKETRDVFTNTRVMKNLLRDLTHRDHKSDIGYGLPEINDLTESRIQNFLDTEKEKK